MISFRKQAIHSSTLQSIVTASLICMIISIPPFTFAKGEGTTITISTGEDLQKIGNDEAYPLDGIYSLGADIDASDVPIDCFRPIADHATSGILAFSGVLDGKNHVIRNLIINLPDSDYVGLFAKIEKDAVLLNIRIEGGAVAGKQYVGALLGKNNSGTIVNCHSNIPVNGSYDIGGLIGLNDNANITSSSSTGMVSGVFRIGGLIGTNNRGNLSLCHTDGDIKSVSDAGGMVGYNSYGIISTCYTTGNVATTTSGDAGGLAGINEHGDISFCYATGNVEGAGRVGGLIGFNDTANILHCYATGKITGLNKIGGLVGYNSGDSSITNSFWDTKRSEMLLSAGGKGKTTAEMLKESTFTMADWDFSNDDGTPATWAIKDGQSYPWLMIFPYIGHASTTIRLY